MILSVILAWGVLKTYDEPVRDFLKKNWLKGEQRLPLWLKITGGALAVLADIVWLANM